MEKTTSAPRLPLLGIALVSGAAALLYQTVWIRWFEVLFGSTVYAASATLCAFFTGLALGSEAFGRLASRSARPLAAYAGLELAAAVLALAVPFVFSAYDPLYGSLYTRFGESRGLLVALKFALALVVMVPPAFLLGGTLPFLAQAFVRDPHALGRQGSLLYAVNTLGAALGSAAGALWLPDHLGVQGTYAIALALGGGLALLALLLARKGAPTGVAQTSAGPVEDARFSLRAIAFASGFGTLALEVLLVRSLARVFDHSVYSFGAVLVVVLLALAVGAAGTAWASGRVHPRKLLAGALALEALLLLLLPAETSRLTAFATTGYGTLRDGLLLTAVLGGPPLLVGAFVFPLTFELASGGERVGEVGRRLGGLLAANTLGGILGSVAASFLLLDRLGLWNSFVLLALGYGLASILAPSRPGTRSALAALLVTLAGLLVWSPASPLRVPSVHLEPGERLLDFAEGAYGVVSVVENRAQGRSLKLDNHYTLSGQGNLAALKERPGHVPLLLHPNPRRVLFVGSATGNTAGAAVAHAVDDIVLVEIVPEVQALAAEHFRKDNRDVHHDPRTRFVVEDGRNHIRAVDERYDVIVSDLFTPWRPGVGSLYTREHFEAVKAHLGEAGVFAQWFPLYQLAEPEFATVAATFLDVFPDAGVWRGDFYATLPRIALVGFRDSPPSKGVVDARVAELARHGGVEDRWVTDPRGFWMLYAGPLSALAGDLAQAPLQTDDSRVFSYRAARSTRRDRARFLRQRWPRIGAELAEGARAKDASFGAAAGRWAQLGALFAQASRLRVEDRTEEVQQTMRALSEQLPARLLQPDPTVSELWLRLDARPRRQR